MLNYKFQTVPSNTSDYLCERPEGRKMGRYVPTAKWEHKTELDLIYETFHKNTGKKEWETI